MWKLSDPLPFSNRLLFIFALPLAIWVAVSLVSVVTLQRALDDYARLEYSQRVLLLASNYRVKLEELRNEERVFQITGSRDALVHRQQKLQEANRTFSQLTHELRANPAQLERLRTAGDRLQEWFYDISERRIRGGFDPEQANADPSIRNAPALVQQFLYTMNELIEEEERALDAHREDINRAAELIVRTIWAGLILGTISTVLVEFWIMRRIGRSVKDINIATEELAKGNMAARVAVGSEGSELAQRFNVMAAIIQNRNQELTALAELGELLNSCNTANEAIRIFQEFSVKLFGTKPGLLYFIDTNKKDVNAVASWGGGEQKSRTHISFDDCWALRLGRTYDNHPDQFARCSHLTTEKRRIRCTPLAAFGEIIGVLCVFDADEVDNEYGKHFSDMVAQQAALSFANVRLRAMLQQQAIRDPLTHLYNRRHLDETIRLEIHRSERHAQPLSALVLDIDHFKHFNDTYGQMEAMPCSGALAKHCGNSSGRKTARSAPAARSSSCYWREPTRNMRSNAPKA
jgi:CHASE3 domain sensor protein